MRIKLFNHIKFSSTTENNLITIYFYECPECKVSDHYLCTDPLSYTRCFNCQEKLYFSDMVTETNEYICRKVIEIEIGDIREEEDNEAYIQEIEKKYLETLKEKYEQS